VDDQYQEEYIFSDDIQFLTPAEVWLGGTPNTYERTNGNIQTNFDGGVAEVGLCMVMTKNDQHSQKLGIFCKVLNL
jgi:hypothetical protein